MPDLSPHLHTDECNKLIKDLQECYSKVSHEIALEIEFPFCLPRLPPHSNPSPQSQFSKWFGNCDTFQVSVDKCLKSERQRNREKNLEAARKRKEDIQDRMNNSPVK